MRVSLEYLQTLAELMAPVASEIGAGLLERPVSLLDGERSVLPSVCKKLHRALQDQLPELQSLIAGLAECEEESIDEEVEDIAEVTFGFIELAREIWELPFPEKEEKARPYLAALAESPAIQVFALFQEVTQSAIAPWAVYENPDEPEVDFLRSVNCRREIENIQSLQKQHPEWDFSLLYL